MPFKSHLQKYVLEQSKLKKLKCRKKQLRKNLYYILSSIHMTKNYGHKNNFLSWQVLHIL